MPYEKIGEGEPVCIADEVPFEIPESWEWVRLGSISTYAQTKQKIKAQNADPDIWGLYLEDIEKGGRLLAERSVGERRAVGDKTYFEKGDILYSKLRPYLLKILIAPNDGICTPEIVPFKLYGKLYSQYIVAFLKCPYVDTAINSATYGVKMPRVGTETMVSLFVPIPPLNEQTRIVAKLDEIFTFVDSYSNAYSRSKILDEQFPEQLKKSILQWAVQGKIVPQDPNDEPASVLLERIRAEKEQLVREGKIKRDKHESVIFRRDNSYYEKVDGIERCIDAEIPFDVPESWSWSRIGAMFLLQAGKNIKGSEICDHSFPGSVPCYGGNGIRGYVGIANRDGDYPIIGRQGALCGNVNRASGTFYATEHAVCVETFSATNVSWACVFLEALNLNQYATATAQPGLAVSKINTVLIPIPPIDEQQRIVDRLYGLIKQIEKL